MESHSHPWILQSRALGDFSELYFRVRNGHGFRYADGSEADLHWYIFHEQCEPGVDQPIWAKALPLQQLNRSSQSQRVTHLLTLDPVDHLLLILAHASRWDEAAPIRWVADAVLLIQAVDHFNWPRFVSLAKDRRLTAPAGALGVYLQGQMAMEVPATVLAELAAATGSDDIQRLTMRSRPDVSGGGEELLYLLRALADRLRQDTEPPWQGAWTDAILMSHSWNSVPQGVVALWIW